MIKTIELLPGVTLRCFQDDRFKQGVLSIQFVRAMQKEESAVNALIPAVLLRGCKSAPDLRAITLRLDDLYGAGIGGLNRRIGDYQTIGMGCRFLGDRYAMEGDRIMASLVEFLRQLLLEPVTEKGVFSGEFLESEKKNRIADIEAQRNDKRSYAAAQLLRHMCREDSYGLPRLGEVEQVRSITAQGAWDHWHRVLRESRVDLFYVGQNPSEAVAQMVLPLFEGIDRSYVSLPEQTPFHSCGGGEFTESMDVAQGRLGMGFSTSITGRDPQMPAMQVCNSIFGGGMTSKLFMNVREKMSLCYDISSGYHGSKGILTVAAGMDFAKTQVVRDQVMTQLEAIRAGQITQEELTAAKEGLCNSLRGIHDSPGGIENYYSSGFLSGILLTPEEYRQRISQVTVQQVAEAAATLVPDTVYCLKGVQ